MCKLILNLLTWFLVRLLVPIQQLPVKSWLDSQGQERIPKRQVSNSDCPHFLLGPIKYWEVFNRRSSLLIFSRLQVYVRSCANLLFLCYDCYFVTILHNRLCMKNECGLGALHALIITLSSTTRPLIQSLSLKWLMTSFPTITQRS